MTLRLGRIGQSFIFVSSLNPKDGALIVQHLNILEFKVAEPQRGTHTLECMTSFPLVCLGQ